LLGHSGIRRVIAKRLTESKQQAPHFYLSMDCNFDALLAAREQLNKSYGAKDGHQPRISVNDFIIKAASLALSRFPNANASWQEDGMVLYNNVDISVAVAVDEGLITPILHNADKKDILTISKEMKLLVSKAKEGTLRPDEFQGGGFTISNLGMFGVKQFSAIVNPPQACILAVGSAEEKPVIINGAVACAKVTNFTLSCDHRVIDGVLAAKLLACIKDYLENPILMFI
jgi:pyruvate dehydrogenase E2 component (dihydrolipoamide acetyltransferase)